MSTNRLFVFTISAFFSVFITSAFAQAGIGADAFCVDQGACKLAVNQTCDDCKVPCAEGHKPKCEEKKVNGERYCNCTCEPEVIIIDTEIGVPDVSCIYIDDSSKRRPTTECERLFK